jgi:hypothetical protein
MRPAGAAHTVRYSYSSLQSTHFATVAIKLATERRQIHLSAITDQEQQPCYDSDRRLARIHRPTALLSPHRPTTRSLPPKPASDRPEISTKPLPSLSHSTSRSSHRLPAVLQPLPDKSTCRGRSWHKRSFQGPSIFNCANTALFRAAESQPRGQRTSSSDKR